MSPEGSGGIQIHDEVMKMSFSVPRRLFSVQLQKQSSLALKSEGSFSVFSVFRFFKIFSFSRKKLYIIINGVRFSVKTTMVQWLKC
jgi:hypothetical protein